MEDIDKDEAIRLIIKDRDLDCMMKLNKIYNLVK